MAADAVEGGLIGLETGGLIGDADGAGAVYADACIDLILRQEFLHAAQRAHALFFHSAHKDNNEFGIYW